MKKLLSGLLAMLLVLALLPAMPVQAAQEQTAWTYETYGEGIVLTAYNGDAADVYVPASVDDKPVIKLGDSLFADNDGLNSVTLAEGITEIGKKTFYDADNLVCIVSCETLTTIGDEAFSGCDSFNSVILYDAVTAIGENAFAACPKLTIWCNEGTAGYAYAIKNSISFEILNPSEIPLTIVQDGHKYYVFNGAATLMSIARAKRVVIPSHVNNYPVTKINAGVLRSLGDIEVFLPNTIVNLSEELVVGLQTIVHCSEGSALQKHFDKHNIPYILTENSAPPEEVSVGDYTFYVYAEEAALKKYNGTDTAIAVPETVNGVPVKKVLPNAISGSVLTAILPDCIDYMYSHAFGGPIKSVNIPLNVTRLPEDLFWACSQLENVKLHDGIKYIGTQALSYENHISEMVLPAGIEHIDEWAFRGTDFTEITYPVNALVEQGAFVNGSLQKVYVPREVTNLNPQAFYLSSYGLNGSSDTDISPVFYVYKDSPAHKVCQQNGLLFHCVDGNEAEPYTYEDGLGFTYMVFPDYAVLMKAFIYSGYETDTLFIPENVAGVPVTQIWDFAFEYQITEESAIKNVVLPDSVTWMGMGVFRECRGLETVALPNGIKRVPEDAFWYCTSLKSITLPANLETIEEEAFYYCAIEELTFPESLQKIGVRAFEGADISTLTYPDIEIEDGAFSYCENLQQVTITEGVESLPHRVFMDCKNLMRVYVPDSVTDVDEYAFAFCPKVMFITEDIRSSAIAKYAKQRIHSCVQPIWDSWIESSEYTLDGITYYLVFNPGTYYGYQAIVISCASDVSGYVELPETITTDGKTYEVSQVGARAFGSSKVAMISLPDSVIAIGDSAFSSSQLKQIDLPAKLEYLGVNVFNNSKLEEITFPSSCNAEFGTCIYTGTLKKVVIPEGVKVIPQSALYGCSNVENIVLPNSLERIEANAISNMRGNITELTIPGGVELEDNAIGGIATLKKVVFEEGIAELPKVLTGCANLELVYLPRSLSYISYEAFNASSKAVLCVYENSYAHEYAEKRGLPYFILRETENPEIAYGAGVTGTVTYTDGTAAADVTVDILYSDGTVKETVKTDATGAYSFTYAEVGAYTIRATDADGNTATTQVSISRMNAFDVFRAGDTDLKLKKGHTVSGNVNGAGTVTLTDRDGNVLASQETADGSFSFENVPNGTYILTAQTETGSVSQEITVFNGDISQITLTVATTAATVWGYVEVEDRDEVHHRRNWVQVTIYNADGIAVNQCKTDKDGKYTFTNLPVGQYAIVAETAEMRPDKKHGFDRSHTLTGYAYVDVTAAEQYQTETIVLYEENDHLATISGKVTANGETQDCEVVLRNVFRHEIAKYTTGKNGKYSFKNVRDGLYFITATTQSDGMGYTVVTVRHGQVYGSTDIHVYKTDKIKAREDKFKNEVPECGDREAVLQYRDRIAEEKRFYDGLSDKEKKQLSKDYVERLNRYAEWIANCQYTTNEGVTVEQGGLVVSGEELENEDEIVFELSVEKTAAWSASTDGVHSGDDYLYHDVHDKAGHRNVAQYYEITMSKTVDGKEVPITSVHKDTDTSGKLRITMPIPEEYRGHKHYSILHVHEGEPVILTDLDNDPDTVTFEVDKFSVFILLETDEEAIDESVSVAASLSDLIAESADGTSLKLQESVTEDVVVDKNIYLNLNGCSINGSVTVAEGYTLYVKDSQTDDYTVEDGNGYGKITGAVSGVVAQEGYMMITEGEETSFHRLNLDTVGLTLRANVTGVYYQSQFGGDEVIKRNIVAYGTALGAGQMPTFADKTYTRFADMTTWKPGMNANGYSNNLKNGTILQGIMSADGGYSSNKRNAGVKIYSQAYVELPNGTRILGKAVGYSLQDIIQGAEGIIGTDAMWNNLEQEQKDPILSMYATYERIMRNWNIPNIKAAAAQ